MSQQPPAGPPAGEDAPVPSRAEVAAEVEAAVEEAVEGAEESAGSGGSEVEERRYPSTIGGAFYLLVLAASTVGLVVVWGGDWRLGTRCLAGALCFAALVRLVLPRKDAGMLAVRNRWFDAVLLGGLGAVIFFLAATIPDQPT